MKRKSIIFIIIGLLFIVGGSIYFSNNSNGEKSENKVIPVNEKVRKYFDDVSSLENDEILSYLKEKYNKDFEVLERVSTYCIQQVDTGSYQTSANIDFDCKNDDIVDDIYKVKDDKDISFYVKRVTLKDGVSLLPELIDFQDSGFYDNYITYIIANKVDDKYKSSFNFLNNVKESYIYRGIGIDNSTYVLKNNKYESYSIYKNLGKYLQDLKDTDISVEDYLAEVDNIYGNRIDYYIRVEEDITKDNFINIVKKISEINDKVDKNLHSVIIEFNNQKYIEYVVNFSIDLYKYDESIYSNLNERVYDHSILLNTSLYSEYGIYLDEFLSLDKESLNI
ncbi:MAG: hypothetical protein IJ568_01915 [Bacilli bacterium]|nr:hypothetical protein [Bacilli bacterium]